MTRAARAAGVLAVALAAVLLVIFVAVKLLDRPTHIYYYRVVDDHTILVGIVTGPGTWTRLTGITEGPDTVSLQVSSLTAPLPGYGDESAEVSVSLPDPIGNRTVIDASTGTVVPFTRCLPPAYLEKGCTETSPQP